MKALVLYVDDDQANLDTFKRAFRFDYEVLTAISAADGLKTIQATPELALIVTDQRMPGMKGTEMLAQAMQINPYAQRIVLTAFTDHEALLKAIQDGHVFDYVVKPWEPKALKETMDKAITIYLDRIEKIKDLIAAKSEAQNLKEQVLEDYNFANIVGADGALSPILDQVKKIAPTNSTVLIRGETGTVKELIAHAIHAGSLRVRRSFIKLNCAALSPGVLESELFGHEKGAFTGAATMRKGRFEMADGGTLFLDEIGDLPEMVQVKLLRVLQEHEFERVGGTATIKTDVRLVAATHQPLERLVEAKKFRQDLFYRINVIPITLPPLRERRNDIPKLVNHFFAKYCRESGKVLSLSNDAMALLSNYDWPGNVRELGNVVERAVILGEGELLPSDFSVDIDAASQDAKKVENVDLGDSTSVLDSIHEANARELSAALKKARGNVSEAARILGVARTTLIHRLKKYHLV